MPILNSVYRHREFQDVATLAGYERAGGWNGLKATLEMTPDDALYAFHRSGLRGRGGAGFPMGRKASFLPKDSGKQTYVVCNADESEPGTFKDREIIEKNPFQLIEGVAIASYAVGCERAYIYIRGEYGMQAEVLAGAITACREAGRLGADAFGPGKPFDITLYRGAGAYICGEETALLESLEGKRGQPRLKPPFPAVAGLYGSPTLINNVETLAALPPIMHRGADWYAALGPEKSPGTKVFSVSGHVLNPGNFEIVMGETTLRELIFDMAGGLREGREMKACWPGGSSVPILTRDHLDVAIDYESLNDVGTFLGSGGCIVMDDSGCIVRASWRLAHFYRHESCGKCTPCREGTGWLYRMVHRIEHGEGRPGDLDTLLSVCDGIQGRTICALGDAAAMPVRAMIKNYTDEFAYHIEHKRCMVPAYV